MNKEEKKKYAKKYRQTHKEEKKEYNKQYRQIHKERAKQYGKQYYEDYKEKLKKHHKQYNQDHEEQIKEKCKQYCENHKEQIKGQHKQYRQNHREEIKEYMRQYRRIHKEKINEHKRIRWQTDLSFNLNCRISGKIHTSLHNGFSKQGYHWETLVGYSVTQLKRHLKKTMPDGYSWQDYLEGKLHIDHIHPIAVFNFTSPEDIDSHRCWALKNLQLLPAEENHRKGTKLIKPFQRCLPIKVEIR